MSGNPGGKVAGRWAGLRKQILEATGDGKALVEFALEVYQGRMPDGQGGHTAKAPAPQLRWDAFVWLSERVWGKAIQPIDLTTHEGAPQPALTPEMLSAMSPAELDVLERMGERMIAASAAAAAEMIDVGG